MKSQHELINDMEELFYISEFLFKTVKTKKNRKKLKKLINHLKNEEYDKVISEDEVMYFEE